RSARACARGRPGSSLHRRSQLNAGQQVVGSDSIAPYAGAVAVEKRTRLDPAARRAQLIELGVQMLATRTLDELSVEDIATQAGISRGLLFHYFASKQEFHVEVARAAAAALIARTAPDPALPPL